MPTRVRGRKASRVGSTPRFSVVGGRVWDSLLVIEKSMDHYRCWCDGCGPYVHAECEHQRVCRSEHAREWYNTLALLAAHHPLAGPAVGQPRRSMWTMSDVAASGTELRIPASDTRVFWQSSQIVQLRHLCGGYSPLSVRKWNITSHGMRTRRRAASSR